MEMILIGLVGIIIIAVLANVFLGGKIVQKDLTPGGKVGKVCWMILIRNGKIWIIL